MEKAKITFSNGNEITVEKNGTSYIVDDEATVIDAVGDSTSVTIETESEEGIQTETIDPFRLIEAASIDERYWFGFIQVSDKEQADIQIRADVDYIAMETGVDL